MCSAPHTWDLRGEHEDDGHDGMGAAHERRLRRRDARAPHARRLSATTIVQDRAGRRVGCVWRRARDARRAARRRR